MERGGRMSTPSVSWETFLLTDVKNSALPFFHGIPLEAIV